MDILLRILSGPPAYVWPLLGLLVVLGLLSARDRETPLWPVFILPLLGLTGLPSLLSVVNPSVSWPAYAAAYALGALWGRSKQRKSLVWKSPKRLSLKGEWSSLGMMMLIFWANFAEGILTAVAPGIMGTVAVAAALPALKGFGSGFFLGRAIWILQAPTDHASES